MTQIIPLTPRLAAIYKQYEAANKDYDIVWDTCCDHGYLGQKILANNQRGQLVFVDQVISITKALSEQLEGQPYTNYTIYTQDLAQLKLTIDKSHLVIIAGIGGQLMAELLPRLLANNKAATDFIFCPSTSGYSLRDYLANNNFGLLAETIVADNNRFYEIIYARYKSADLEGVSLLGEMWDRNSSDHQRYLKNLINLYEKRLMGSKASAAQEILALYQQCYDDNFN
jgi:tRNA (adenine22-N1)-methyltransferase